MNISSTKRQATQQIKAQKPQKPEGEPSVQQRGVLDRFSNSAKSEMPKALTYGALAGAAAGLAGHYFNQTAAALSMGQAAGFGALAGLGVGLAAGLVVSVASMNFNPTTDPKTPDTKNKRIEPKLPDIKPKAEVSFMSDLQSTGKKLERRIGLLDSLLKAERSYAKSGGRSGIGTVDALNKQLGTEEKIYKNDFKERPPIAELKSKKAEAKQHLDRLRGYQAEVLKSQAGAEEVKASSLNRTGRKTEARAEKLNKDIKIEIARVQKGFQPAGGTK